MSDVVTFGESMARLSATRIGPLHLSPQLDLGIAGAESNLAVGLARLGSSVTWMSRVADDEFAQLITSTLRGEGVDVRTVTDPEAPTGLLIKNKRTVDTTHVAYYRAGSAASRLAPSDLDHDLIARARVLHITGITAALGPGPRAACFAAVETARANGVAVSFDFNMRRKLWSDDEARDVLHRLVTLADVVFASDDEARIIVDGDAPEVLAENISALGPTETIIKLGDEGAVSHSAGTTHVSRGYRVVELDPVGAGDAFCAGYLHGAMTGLGLADRLDLAARCGAYAVTVDGDWEGLPTQRDLALLGGADVHR